MQIMSSDFSLFEDIKRSLTRVNPQTHLKQDSYFKPELKGLLGFFWPKRLTAGDLTTLRTAFLDRAEQVVRRQMVRIVGSLSFGIAYVDTIYSTPLGCTRGSALLVPRGMWYQISHWKEPRRTATSKQHSLTPLQIY